MTGPEPADRDTFARMDEALLGGARRFDAAELAAEAGLGEEEARAYWQALGLPIEASGPDGAEATGPEGGEAIGPDGAEATATDGGDGPGAPPGTRGRSGDPGFTVDDVDALRQFHAFAQEEGLDPRTVISLVRSIGHSTERMALWQFEALVEHAATRHRLDDASARLLVLARLAEFAPVLEAQLVHAWRRQLAAVAGRFAAEFGTARASDVPVRGSLPLPRAVGFADIVSFTGRTSGMDSLELSEFVQQFEASARDVVVQAGGRVVKTIGDAVLFVADDVAVGAAVADGLSRIHELAVARPSPPVRVSLVWGRVLSRFGDVFGAPVTLASRLVDQAEPGSVLVDPGTALALRDDPRFELIPLESRELRGLGAMAPFRLRAAAAGAY